MNRTGDSGVLVSGYDLARSVLQRQCDELLGRISSSLMEKIERMLLDLCRPPLMTASGEAKPKLQIKGECQLPPLASQYQDTALERKSFEELTKPYGSTHRGLPVRVDKRVLVWRSNDTEALAADYFRHPTTGDVHFARLYRVPTPKT